MIHAVSEIGSADDLVGLFRQALIAESVRFETSEVAPAPDPQACWRGFLSFCREPLWSPSGVLVVDEVQVESSLVQARLDPYGAHRSPGPYSATWSRRITIADADGEAIRIHEAALQIYFGDDAVGLGETFFASKNPLALRAATSESLVKPAKHALDVSGSISEGEPSALWNLPTQQAVLAASELYDVS